MKSQLLHLCTLHHRALDAGLFCIDPKTLEILFKDDGPKADKLRITRSNIKHLRAIPHADALEWINGDWSK